MKIKLTTFFLLTLLLSSCGKKNGSTPPQNLNEKNIQPELVIDDPTSDRPKLSYLLKTQTEDFYIPRDTQNLRISITPQFKKVALRENLKHLTHLRVYNHRWNTSELTGSCGIIESRIKEFNILKTDKPLSYQELNLVVDGAKINFSPEKNFEQLSGKSNFKVNLPKSRGDFYINISTSNHSRPALSLYDTSECDRIIFEHPDREITMNVSSTPAQESTWTSYQVDIFYEINEN